MSKIKRDLPLNGAAWRRLRGHVLGAKPLCEDCNLIEGNTTAATEVHHVDNNPNNNALDNLMSLCKPCHSRRTNYDMGRNVNWGVDVHGVSLNPNHHWNVGTERGKSQNTFPPVPTPQPYTRRRS